MKMNVINLQVHSDMYMNRLRLFLIENVHIIHNVGNRLGAHPISTTCFHCHQNIVTTTTTSTSTKQCLIGLLLAAVGYVKIVYQCFLIKTTTIYQFSEMNCCICNI